MDEMKEQPFGFEDWKEKYRVVLCLKRTQEKETWLLEEKKGKLRCVLKKAKEGQGQFLKAEYELLCELKSRHGMVEFDSVEFRCEAGWEYLLREFVQGVTFEELVEREGALSAEEAAFLGEKLCRKTAVFHNQNPRIIHRDIKPENIVITASGSVRLIDFETARSYKQGQKTDTVRMGTRGYAAPEQFGFGQTDVRSDIYAIGKVLLYMVTAGCEEDDMKLLQKGKEKRLKRIIRRCIAYDPSARYQSVEQLSDALAQVGKYDTRYLKETLILTGLLTVLCAAVIYLGIKNNYLKRQLGYDMPEISAAGIEEVNNLEGAGEENSTDGISRWNPYEYEEDVKTILQMYLSENVDEMANACEIMVEKLYQSECIMKVVPVFYEKMPEKELEAYHKERMGYEYIADRLAYEDRLSLRCMGSYEQKGHEIAGAIQECLEYFYINEEGKAAESELYGYLSEGSSKNMDGCIIELLDCINRGLQ